jgi:hypothetical protein
MRTMVEGPSRLPNNPSTALRAVPLPGECRGGLDGYDRGIPTSLKFSRFAIR